MAPDRPDDPPTDRDDLVRALRAALLDAEQQRARALRLTARVTAIASALRGHLADGSDAALATLDDDIARRERDLVERLREADLARDDRVHLGDPDDKYAIDDRDGPPCAELIELCQARCCTYDVALSTQDLDEGVIRWHADRPYLLHHDDDGYCGHFDRGGGGCTAYHHRPGPCRTFDCRDDPRVWIDYARRLPAPPGVPDPADWSSSFNLLDRVRRHDAALAAEAASLRGGDQRPPDDD